MVRAGTLRPLRLIPKARFAVVVLAALLPAASATAASTTSVSIRLHGTEAPVVVLRVQGRALPLQLDLGDSSSLVLHPEVLAGLRSTPTPDKFSGFSMDGKIETPVFRFDRVELGGLRLSGVAARADVHDEAFRAYKKTRLGAVGFVGAGLFKTGQIRVDYSRKKLTISLPDRSGVVGNICRGPAVPIAVNQFGLTTAVRTDIGELQWGWDTGMPGIAISRSTADAARLPAADSVVFETFTVGGGHFGPQRVEIWNIPLPKEIAGLVGHPFFEKHVVCFDYAALALHVR